MEGVGARFGRSSRYAPATSVFTGPVRKWRKKWVPVTPSSSSSASPASNPNSSLASSNHNNHQLKPCFVNGVISGSHVQLYKWAPLSDSQSSTNHNTNGNGNGTVVGASSNSRKKNKSSDDGDKDSSPAKDDASVQVEPPPPRRKYKYLPVFLLEEQHKEEGEQVEDEAKSEEADETVVEAASKASNFAEKPDINDVPMEEAEDQDDNHVERQDLNKSTLDLSLGWTSTDGDQDSASQPKQE